MSDINVNMEKCDIEASHRFGKPDVVILKPKKAIVCFVNKKSCNKTFENKKKLAKLNKQKHNLREGAKSLLNFVKA